MSATAQIMANSSRRGGKSAAAFRTISEVATEIVVPAHVLRFWETKFSQIRPLKRGGGRRFYRPEDVELLRAIRRLLYDDGYTIRGVQKLLKSGAFRLQEESKASGGAAPALFDPPPAAPKPAAKPAAVVAAAGVALGTEQKGELRETLRELMSLRDLLAQASR